MAALSPQAQRLLSGYASTPGVTPDQAANLAAVINASPALIDQINDAGANGQLKGFAPLPPGTNAGGRFQPSTQFIELPPGMLTTPQGQPFNGAEAALVLGHEVQHGVNAAATAATNKTFVNELVAEAKKPLPVHDYTQEIDKKLAQNRRDEAGGEIAGWNALVDYVKTTNPNATLADIYNSNRARASDFVDRNGSNTPFVYSPKSNLTLNQDLTITPTAANIEAMGVNYFDKNAKALGGTVGLGHHGNSDYVNYYGAVAIGKAAEVDSRYAKAINGVQPQMGVDMGKLRLSERLLEENGIDLGKGNPAPKAYLDIGVQPPRAGLFQHTATTHTHALPIREAGLELETTPTLSQPALGRRRSPDDPEHPDHGMLEEIRSGVRKLDAEAGKPYDDTSERLSRSMLAATKDNRDLYPHLDAASLPANALSRVDHVMLGKGGRFAIAVEGGLTDPAHKIATVDVAKAIDTPMEQSDAKLEAASKTIAQQLELAPQQELTRGPDDPSRSGPTR